MFFKEFLCFALGHIKVFVFFIIVNDLKKTIE